MADMQEVDWEEKDSNPLHEEEDEEQLDSSKPEAVSSACIRLCCLSLCRVLSAGRE